MRKPLIPLTLVTALIVAGCGNSSRLTAVDSGCDVNIDTTGLPLDVIAEIDSTLNYTNVSSLMGRNNIDVAEPLNTNADPINAVWGNVFVEFEANKIGTITTGGNVIQAYLVVDECRYIVDFDG